MILNKTIFRSAGDADRNAIYAVTNRAFGRKDEAELVGALLDEPVETPSFVAELDGHIVGHLLFSELQGPQKSLALAPLSVDPDWRDFLIGTELARFGIQKVRDSGWQSVFVLGDPVYYGRFGFKSRTADPVDCPYQGPHFMAMELADGALSGYAGPVRYPDPFSRLA